MKDAAEIVRHLVDHGVVDVRGIVDGRLVAHDRSRRNRNLLIAGEGLQPLFVKAGIVDPNDVESIEREREVRRRLAGARPEIAELVPGLIAWDTADPGLLVVEGVAGARDLRAYHLEREAFPPDVGARVGAALAALHAATRVQGSAPAPDRAPAAFRLHRPSLESLRWLTPGSLDLIRALQSQPAFGRRIDEVRDGWRIAALIHRDVKWDNLLLAPDGGLRIVDWEHAEDGDPRWDAGSAIAAYLAFWAASVPSSEIEPSKPAPERARFPLEEMRPAIWALWRAYAEGTGLAPADADRLVLEVLEMAAVRLLQSAYELTASGGELDPPTVLVVQLAMNLLERPGEAAEELLGLHTAARGLA